MFAKVLSCMVLVVFVFVSLPAVTMGHTMLPGKWWRVPQVAERLDLSEVEKAQLDDLFFHNRRKLLQYKRTVEEKKSQLQSMLERDPLDEALVTDTVKELQEARTNLGTERFRFTLEVRKMLGLERFQRLKKIFKEISEKKASPNKLQGAPKERSWLHFW